MQKKAKTFSYTAQRGSYLSIVGVLLFLFIVESSVLELCALSFVPMFWLRFSIIGVSIGLHLFLAIRMLSPIWTRHSLTDTHLNLRYGFTFKVDIPLTSICSAQETRKHVSVLEPLNAYYKANEQSLIVCFSDQGTVLLTLHWPLELKINGRMLTVITILLNVDQRDDLLAALNERINSVIKDPETKDDLTEPVH